MTNDVSKVYGYTGAEVVKTQGAGYSKTEIVHKATGDTKPELPDPGGLAKASPAFKPVKPNAKVAASKKAQEDAIESNTISTNQEKDKEESQDAKNDSDSAS